MDQDTKRFRNESSGKTERQRPESLLATALAEWGTLYRRKVEDAALEIWIRLFKIYRFEALTLALDRVTREAEHMPTPGDLTKALNSIIEQKPWLGLHWKHRLSYQEGQDEKGVPCVFWSDAPTIPAYRASDCPEGRMFLALLKDMANAKQMPPGTAVDFKPLADSEA